MIRLFIIIPLLLVFVWSCGLTSQHSDTFSSLLSFIPSKAAENNVIWFNNIAKLKQLTGKKHVKDSTDYFKWENDAERQRLDDIFAGWVQSMFAPGIRLEEWYDTFGFDALNISQEIWVQKMASSQGGLAPFSVMKGKFDKNTIAEKLSAIGYQQKKHASLDYYSINEDYSLGTTNEPEGLLLAHGFLNRMMITNEEIIAAPADEIIFPVFDVHSNQNGSLKNSLSYTRVIEALGDILGAGLVPLSVINPQNAGANWNMLHTYDLAGIGYFYEEAEQKLLIVLHYPDRSAANDVDELKRRMADYKVTTGNPKPPLLSDLFNISEPEVTNFETDSILKIELTFKLDVPRNIWSPMIQMQDISFLVQNP